MDEQTQKPDGYAYRYPDGCVRFNRGQHVNGCRPTEAIPYYFGRPEAIIYPQERMMLVEPVQNCTRASPHICRVNGPCNGWPKEKESDRAEASEHHDISVE